MILDRERQRRFSFGGFIINDYIPMARQKYFSSGDIVDFFPSVPSNKFQATPGKKKQTNHANKNSPLYFR